MARHRIHEEIGGLLNKKGLPEGTIFRDSACQRDDINDEESKKKHRLTLYKGSGPDRVRMCDVDILALREGRGIVIIEIEESNVKPVQVFGKFFASAHSTHHGNRRIDDRPLLFIQVLVAPAVDLVASGKLEQWRTLEAIIKRYARRWSKRDVQYKLFGGGPGDFKPGSDNANRLISTVRDFLDVRE